MSTIYDKVVIQTVQEYNPSRPTRQSTNPVLRDCFTPLKPARNTDRVLNYPEVEIIKKHEVTQIYKPNKLEPQPELNEIQVKPEPREEMAGKLDQSSETEFECCSVARKCKTLEHRNVKKRASSVRNITQQFEDRTALKSKSFTLNRTTNKQTNRRTSVREMAQLYDNMAQDNSLDQLTQSATFLTRSTSYYKKKALERTATDYINLTPTYSGCSSRCESPQLYINVSPNSKSSSSCYENISPPKISDPYEEVFPGKYVKVPETGEIVKSHFSFSMDPLNVPTNQKRHFSESSVLEETANQMSELIRSAERQETFQKPRAETIATIGTEECEIALGHFPVKYQSKSTNEMCDLTLSVFKSRVKLTGVKLRNLPSNILLMDILVFQPDPKDSQQLNLLTREGNAFQSHTFSLPSNSVDDVITCLREAVSEEKTATLQTQGTEEYFALLLGCSPVPCATGMVAQGVERITATHKLSQAVQVRIDVRDGFIVYPFGRSQSLCNYRLEQVKGVAVWEKDPRVLGVVTCLKPGKFLCYAMRFNRTNQLQAAFTSIRHFCRGEVTEEKKKNAWYMNLISKKKPKSGSNSESNSRPSTPTVDQIDPDTFTLLYLGTTQPGYKNFTSECIQQEHSNLLEGRNVSEMVAPPPTTILNVSDNSLRLTDRDKIHFLKRVYQRGAIVACISATGNENLLGLVTQRPGTNELKCSIFRPTYSEAGHVAQHVMSKLKL